ncbi:MAG: DUF4173 domain-containing protein, partial [Anaerolineaceae bacterium]|nr:DUF4173 domain-containing protein [Anaerolineaceae bacterium]
YTHIFIPWLGLLLAVTILLQVLRRDQYFGAVLLAVVIGFSLSFAVLNVDGLIARQNVTRAQSGTSLDGAYLVNLSDDALPSLVGAFKQRDRLDAPVYEVLGGVLACRVYRDSLERPQPWQSYHPGSAAARQLLATVDLSSFIVKTRSGTVYVDLNDGPFQCFPPQNFD